MKRTALITAIAINSVICLAQVNWQDNKTSVVFARQGGETPEGTFRFVSGGYEVFTIHSADKSFQPASLYYGKDNADKSKVDTMVPDGKVPTSMNCFAVKTPDGVIMFDTGLPVSKGGKTLERLAMLNIKASEVKVIYLTHGHFDHIGGLIDEKGNAQYAAATVYVPETEYNFMKESMADATAQIENAYKDRIIVFEPGNILPGNILPIQAKGHTPGHTAYQLGQLLFAGDLMHGAEIQLIDPTICAGYDADRSQAIDSRIKLLNYAVSNSLTVLGAHIPDNGVIF